MLSTIVSILIFVVPIAVFLAVQFFSQQSRNKNHWPGPKTTDEAGETDEARPGAAPTPGPTAAIPRKTRARPVRGPNCGREFTHAFLTIIGSRDSCKHCAALKNDKRPNEPIDLLAEAERIANDAQD